MLNSLRISQKVVNRARRCFAVLSFPRSNLGTLDQNKRRLLVVVVHFLEERLLSFLLLSALLDSLGSRKRPC